MGRSAPFTASPMRCIPAQQLPCVVTVILTVFSIVSVELTHAQPAEPQPQVWRMTVSPAAPPEPALRYRFTPHPAEWIEGNAAALYHMAILSLPRMTDETAPVDKLLGLPREEFDVEAARRALGPYGITFRQMELAARRQRAGWDLPLRQEGISILLPHLNHMRQIANALMLRARVEMTQGQFEQAVDTLRIGFMLAQHLGDEAVLINGLVAAGIANMTTLTARELIETPGSPNLYWALANLPDPLIDLQQVIDGERVWIYYTIPGFDRARRGELAAEEWPAALRGMVIVDANAGVVRQDFRHGLAAAVLVAQALPSAREHLRQLGYTSEQIEQMPPAQIVGMYQIDQLEKWMDVQAKWWGLPFWQAWPGILQDAERYAQARAQVHGPLVHLLPTLHRARLSFARVERDLAALQTVEALRAHAAANGRALPDSLDELVLPVPIDPFHGRPFEYERTEGGGVLRSAAPERESAHHTLRVEITLRND